MARLRLSSGRRDGSVIVTIVGDLDIVTSPELDEHLRDARRETSWIILDMAGLDFMDTNALAVIVNHWKRVGEAGGTLALVGARYQYTRALWITGLATRLPMYDTLDQAIAAGAAPGSKPGPPPKHSQPGPRQPKADPPAAAAP